MQRLTYLLVLILVTSVISPHAQGGGGRGPQGPPNITGTWAGTWSAYNPARATAPPKELCAKLTAAIAQKGDAWGTADLGPKDGGVYDGIGRANDKEFVGFVTSGFYTGVFTMTKAN